MRFSTFTLMLLHLTGFAAAKPNILFAIADDWSVHAGAYDTEWVKTPNFDRVAREGVLFKNAYTPNAKCGPSRSAVITGRYPWQLEVAANHVAHFPAKFKSWPELLVENGWHVGFTGKGWGPGTALDAEGKQRLITGKTYNQRQLKPLTKGIGKLDYAANFTDFLDANRDARPWCFWYGSHEPHRGYEYGSGIKIGGKKLTDITSVPGYWPDNETVRTDMLDYALELEHSDRHLGLMLAKLEERGLLENTIVIVTSDHGMPFPRVKGYAYHDSNHIPLAVRWPAGIKKADRVITDFVDLTDIAPTILDLVGIPQERSGMAEMAGKTWRAILESEASGRIESERNHVLIGKERTDVGRPNDAGYPIRGIVTDDFLFLKNYEPDRWLAGNPETGYLDTDGSPTKTHILELGRQDHSNKFWQLNFGKRRSEELYDLSKDPDCVSNLAAIAGHQATLENLKNTLTAGLLKHGDPRISGDGAIFDSYPPAFNTRFHERYLNGENPEAGWVNPSDFKKEVLK